VPLRALGNITPGGRTPLNRLHGPRVRAIPCASARRSASSPARRARRPGPRQSAGVAALRPSPAGAGGSGHACNPRCWRTRPRGLPRPRTASADPAGTCSWWPLGHLMAKIAIRVRRGCPSVKSAWLFRLAASGGVAYGKDSLPCRRPGHARQAHQQEPADAAQGCRRSCRQPRVLRDRGPRRATGADPGAHPARRRRACKARRTPVGRRRSCRGGGLGPSYRRPARRGAQGRLQASAQAQAVTGRARGAPRWVLDTNVVLAALVRPGRTCGKLRLAWQSRLLIPLAGSETIAELVRVLAYPQCRLAPEEQQDLLADYLPWVEAASAEALVTGDADLHAATPLRGVEIITPSQAIGRLSD